jgi:catechol-2,3-dioxygenase
LEALLAHLEATDQLDAPLPRATVIGHVHLHVADLDQAVDFYRRLLGFGDQGISARQGAAFVSAGGYHHHIGLKRGWESALRRPGRQQVALFHHRLAGRIEVGVWRASPPGAVPFEA